MSLSVSSFPEAHSRLTTNPTWGEGPSPTTKRRFFGGRFNTGGASFMKGIRFIGKVQLKSSVIRRAPKSSSQNLPPTSPPRLSVRASTIVVDIIAVPHDDGRQSSTDISHDASIPNPIPWLRWRAIPRLVSNPRQRAISSGARGAASGTVQQPRTRVNSEAARAARGGGSTSPSLPWQLKTEEMGPVPDLPVVILTPADASDPDGSPSGVTHELPVGDSNLRRRETRTTVHRRSLSSPPGKHVGSKIREPPLPPPPPSPLPLLSMHIAPLRSGSRPTPTPLTPLLAATERRPKTAPTTTRATNPVAPTVLLPMPPRRLTGPRSMRDGHGSAGFPPNMSRSRSQPQLRTAAIVRCATRSAAASSAADGQPISSRPRAGSLSPALAPAERIPGHLQPFPVSAGPAAATGRSAISAAETPEVLQEAPPVRASPRGGEAARGERRPRTAPETGHAARPLAPVVAMDPRAAWELREMGAAGARQRATRPRLPYGPR